MKQNKKILSLLMALVMCLSLLPSVAFAADTSGLQTLIDNDTSGTVMLTQDYTLSDTVTIDKAITLDGNGKTITITGSNKDALNITADGVTVKNLNIVTDYGNAVNCTAETLTVEGCNILTTKRGVNFTATNYPNAALTVKNTVIKNKNVSNYDKTADYGNDNRGINACDVKGGSVTIDGCQILGFKYSINALVLAPNANGTGLRDGQQTTYTIKGTTVKGWTALSIWSANTNFDITNCNFVGINTLGGGTNNYATIECNSGMYGGYTDKSSTVTISGGKLTAVQYGDAGEAVISVDHELQTKFSFEPTVEIWSYLKGSTPEKVIINVWNYDYLSILPNAETLVKDYMSTHVEGYDDFTEVYGGTLAQYEASLTASPAFVRASDYAPEYKVEASTAENVIGGNEA